MKFQLLDSAECPFSLKSSKDSGSLIVACFCTHKKHGKCISTIGQLQQRRSLHDSKHPMCNKREKRGIQLEKSSSGGRDFVLENPSKAKHTDTVISKHTKLSSDMHYGGFSNTSELGSPTHILLYTSFPQAQTWKLGNLCAQRKFPAICLPYYLNF